MEQNSHVRKVEKAMKDALKNDRARIQVGRISSFGLMEMSRQRLRTGVLEASTKSCPHCEGTGLMRTASSAGLSALRMIEDEAARGRGDHIVLRAGREAAIYLLNKKRAELSDIEHRYGVFIDVVIDEGLEGARMAVESSGPRPTALPRAPQPTPVELDDEEVEEILDEEDDDEDEAQDEDESSERSAEADDRNGRKRRRRRRGGRGRSRREDGEGQPREESSEPGETGEASEAAAPAEGEEGSDDRPQRSRRRRRRGGRKPDDRAEQGSQQDMDEAPAQPDSSPMTERPVSEEEPVAETQPAEEPKPAPKRRSRKAAVKTADAEVGGPASPEAPPAETAGDASPDQAAEEAPAKKPARRSRAKKADAPSAEEAQPEAAPKAVGTPAPKAADHDPDGDEPDDGPRRGGWWQRTFG